MVTQKTTRVSYGSKVKSSLSGLIIGPILILVAIYFLWTNEFGFVNTEKAIIEGESIVTEVDSKNPNSANDGNYIYTSGNITSDEIFDSEFNLNINGIIAQRNVEMFQWRENAKTESTENLGGSTDRTTTYTYEKVWSNFLIDSSGFEEDWHENPSFWPFEDLSFFGENPQFEAYTLSDNLFSSLPTTTKLSLGSNVEEEIQTLYGTGYSVNSDYIYKGENLQSPSVGDIRISYKYLPNNSTISVLAQQVNTNTLDIYKAKNGKKISKINVGEVSKETMFQQMKDANSFKTWAFRIGFLFLMFIGFQTFLSIIPTLGKVVPFIGTLLGVGVWIISFVGTLIFGLGTIAIAWLFARPLISITLFVIIIGGIFALKQLKKNKADTSPISDIETGAA